MSAKCCLEYNRDVCFVTGNGLQYVIIFLNENDEEIDISGYDSFDYYLMQGDEYGPDGQTDRRDHPDKG